MSTINKILVPVDLSIFSFNALEYAIQLSGHNGAHIYLLHVCEDTTSIRERPSVIKAAREKAKKDAAVLIENKLASMKKELSPSLQNYPDITTIVELGDTYNVVLKVADEKKVDMIIIGTRGASNVANIYLGSTAMEVYRNANCPVLIVPKEGKFNERINIAYASDFLDADPFKIWKARSAFKPLSPSIRFIHFSDKSDSNHKKQIQELKDFISETMAQLDITFHDLPSSNWIDDMNKFIEKQDINVLVIYKPKRNFFDSLFKKSFTREMALHMEVPLLVFKEE